MSYTQNIDIPLEAIAEFCRRNAIRKLSVFGSALREDFRPGSDVDLLVEYEPRAVVTYLDMAGQEIELSELLGRKVDLRTPEELSQYFRQKVLNLAEMIYERT